MDRANNTGRPPAGAESSSPAGSRLRRVRTPAGWSVSADPAGECVVAGPADHSGRTARLHVSARIGTTAPVRGCRFAGVGGRQSGLHAQGCLVPVCAARGQAVHRAARGTVSPGLWRAAGGDQPDPPAITPATQRLRPVGASDRNGARPASSPGGMPAMAGAYAPLSGRPSCAGRDRGTQPAALSRGGVSRPVRCLRRAADGPGCSRQPVVAQRLHGSTGGHSLGNRPAARHLDPRAPRQTNGLSSTRIYPGQALRVPEAHSGPAQE